MWLGKYIKELTQQFIQNAKVIEKRQNYKKWGYATRLDTCCEDRPIQLTQTSFTPAPS